MPEVRRITAVPRPLRVAYLIDPSNCPHALLDGVFEDAFGRWGGRRTLLVATTEKGIDSRYADWLRLYDPDVIYSFVDLDDRTVADVHERYAPAYLEKHYSLGYLRGERGEYSIRLPIVGLPSISTVAELSASASRSFSPADRVRILDKYPDNCESDFLAENFGFASDPFLSRTVTYAFPTIFTCLTLISETTFLNPRMKKDAHSDHVFSEDDVLDALTTSPDIVTNSQLSDLFAPYIEFGPHPTNDACSLVIGDSIDDRWLYWNLIHRYQPFPFPGTNLLRVSEKRASDMPFMRMVVSLLARRTSRGPLVLRSCSLAQERLVEIATDLRGQKLHIPISIEHASNHATSVPKLSPRTFKGLQNPTSWRYESREIAEFENKRAPVPLVMPWHLVSTEIPRDYRYGCWMSDLTIERPTNHSKYTNVTDTWVFPRRMRVDRAFHFEPQTEPAAVGVPSILRVASDGSLSTTQAYDQKKKIISIPEDIDAFIYALCVGYHWAAFDRKQRSTPAERGYRHVQLSEKGRYLLGILDRFDELRVAFAIFMNAYWREVLHEFGGVPIEKNIFLVRNLAKVIRRRIGPQSGPVILEKESDVERLARESLRLARQTALGKRSMTYSELRDLWVPWIDRSPHPLETKEGETKDQAIERLAAKGFAESVQFLCATELLYQGRDWTCRSCGNRNWISIGGVDRELVCAVCRKAVPAPISGDWHFRADSFLIEAYRDHGVEAVIWTLWFLWKRAKRSFYFAPSLSLWKSDPEGQGRDAELDLLVVVDGTLYVCEVKNGKDVSKDEKTRLADIVERIRPDVLLIALMDKPTGPSKLRDSLKELISPDIEVELISFAEDQLEPGYYLMH